MKSYPRKKRQRLDNLPRWTQANAVQLVPYLRSVVGSIREHFLEMQQNRLCYDRLKQKGGRPNRHEMIVMEETRQNADRAEQNLHETWAEIEPLGVRMLNPIEGLALIPFVHRGELAWFVFDLFAIEGLSGWRYHHDPLDMRRPLNEIGKVYIPC